MKATFLFAASAAAALSMAGPAAAAIVGFDTDVDLSGGSYTVTFGDANYTFAALTDSSNPYATVGMGVGGTALVFGNGFGSSGKPAPLQIGIAVPTQLSLGEFFAPSGIQAIDYSIARTFLALEFTDAGQTYFGYAEVGGSYLLGIAYNDVPGGSILTGQTIDPAPAAAVPEPASWAMLIAGFGLVGGSLRRRSARSLQAA